jgi:hypothetical protein
MQRVMSDRLYPIGFDNASDRCGTHDGRYTA